MVNNNPDMFMATTLTENWVGTEATEHTVDIRNYITMMEVYGKESIHNDSYGNAATYEDGFLTTTMKSLYGSNNKCHYGKFGYSLIGADAAYNMYRALHANDFAILKTDTSGYSGAQSIFQSGGKITLDVTDMTENLSFRAACGSTAGTLIITVKSNDEDITENVVVKEGLLGGTVDTKLLREYENVTIDVTYAPLYGTEGSVIFNVIVRAPICANTYTWNFDDLNARDESGAVVNGFVADALQGSYTLKDGILKANGLQLQLQKEIVLSNEKNWSVEWRFGELSENASGFLLCNTQRSEIGTKAVYYSFDRRIMISDYANSKGYRNFTDEEASFAADDTFKIKNVYNSETEKAVMSLWKNDEAIIENLQFRGAINSGELQDMSDYPLTGDITFRYLGCSGLSYFLVTGELDYLKINFFAATQ